VKVARVAALMLLAGCAGGNTVTSTLVTTPQRVERAGNSATPIQHIVVIVQENRSVDDLFQFLPGADTQSYGYDTKHDKITLQPVPLTAPYDMQHNHHSFIREYNDGGMDGFNRDGSDCKRRPKCPGSPVRAYGYVPQGDVQPYYAMAETYSFADELFQSNQGPSFPAHQYIVSGTSTTYNGSKWRAAENPGHQLGGCDSPPRTTVLLIGPKGQENRRRFPCFDRISIFTTLDQAGVSWKYYQAFPGAHLWNAVDALKPIWENKAEYSANVIVPPSKVLTDIRGGKLASVVFVTPTAADSDHAGVNKGTGPSWVASVVNTIGKSGYWKSTAIIVVWDDWGGWYDHVAPKVRNSYELGFRVPMIVISPYAKSGYVSHVPYEFGSILKFIEETFGLPPLGTTDVDVNDLNALFVFGASPRAFRTIQASHPASYFLNEPPSNVPVDDD
jgi:phospholipase C